MCDCLLCRPEGPSQDELDEEWAREHDFNVTWSVLADRSEVDSLGGAEYTRVLAEWKAAGRPTPVIDFIVAKTS